MAQYVVSSVIQGLLGRQPDMMGSWGTYCSLNLMYLPGAGAGGGQGCCPQPRYLPALLPAASGDAAGPAWGQDTSLGSAVPSALPPPRPLPLTPRGRWTTSPGSWPWPSCSTRSGAGPRGTSRPCAPSPTPSPTSSPRSPPACSSPCSWPARDARSRVRAWEGGQDLMPTSPARHHPGEAPLCASPAPLCASPAPRRLQPPPHRCPPPQIAQHSPGMTQASCPHPGATRGLVTLTWADDMARGEEKRKPGG